MPRILPSPRYNCQPFTLSPQTPAFKNPKGESWPNRTKMLVAPAWLAALESLLSRHSNTPGRILLVYQTPQWAQIKVQVFRPQAKRCGQFVDFRFKLHERLPHLLNLCVLQAS